MITFKQFLYESQNYPLYHATDYMSLNSIIKENRIIRGLPDRDSHWPTKDGSIVSTTRSFKFAKEWHPYIIELDRGKLKQNYKIVPFNYFGSEINDRSPLARWPANKSHGDNSDVDRNQYEEAITKDIFPALRYITKIHFANSSWRSKFKRLYPDTYQFLERKQLI